LLFGLPSGSPCRRGWNDFEFHLFRLQWQSAIPAVDLDVKGMTARFVNNTPRCSHILSKPLSGPLIKRQQRWNQALTLLGGKVLVSCRSLRIQFSLQYPIRNEPLNPATEYWSSDTQYPMELIGPSNPCNRQPKN
jgi:hypothetical protein